MVDIDFEKRLLYPLAVFPDVSVGRGFGLETSDPTARA
jgi:hypothetical protein